MTDRGSQITTRYEARVSQALKSAIWSKGLTIRTFAHILTEKGSPHSFEALSTKLYRGTFSAFYELASIFEGVTAKRPTIRACSLHTLPAATDTVTIRNLDKT